MWDEVTKGKSEEGVEDGFFMLTKPIEETRYGTMVGWLQMSTRG